MATLTHRDGVATITLNRPGRRNALDTAAKTALRASVDEVAGDPAVRAVVLIGAGPAFCVGQDLVEHVDALRVDPAHAFDTVGRDYAPVIRALTTMDKPVVAAVNGACVGAGLALALACDLRVFAEDAILGTAFSAIGLTCDSGLASTLTRSVGESRARELVLLGEPFTPREAVGWGISGRVVPRAEVADTARELAARLACGPTAAFAESKRLLAGAWDAGLDATLVAEAAAQARLGLTHDHLEAVEAFLAKRRPEFNGR